MLISPINSQSQSTSVRTGGRVIQPLIPIGKPILQRQPITPTPEPVAPPSKISQAKSYIVKATAPIIGKLTSILFEKSAQITPPKIDISPDKLKAPKIVGLEEEKVAGESAKPRPGERPITPILGIAQGFVKQFSTESKKAQGEKVTYSPQTIEEKIGVFAHDFVKDIVAYQGAGINKQFGQLSKTLGATLENTPAFVRAQDKVTKFAVKQLSAVANRFKTSPLTFKDIKEITAGRLTDPEKIRQFNEARRTGLLDKIIANYRKTGEKGGGKIYDYLTQIVDNLKKKPTAVETAETKLLSSGTLTPEETIAKVATTELEGTPVGKQLVKTAIEAKQQGVDVAIKVTDGAVEIKAGEFLEPIQPEGVGGELESAKQILKNNTFKDFEIKGLLGLDPKYEPQGIPRDIWKQATKEMGITEKSFVEGTSGNFHIPTQPKGVGGVPSANELANKAGVSNEAKIQKIPLSKISGTDYSELDEALKSGKKLTPKEANDLIGRTEDLITQGRKVSVPISVGDKGDGTYYLLGGNNRIAQALVNGEKTINATSNDFRTGISFQDYAKSLSSSQLPTQPKGVPSEKLTLEPTRATKETEIVEEAMKVDLEGQVKLKESKELGRLEAVGYKKPNIGRTEIITLLNSSNEFSKNPVLTTGQDDAGKFLEFAGQKIKFKLRPGGIALNMDKLKVGDEITVDKEMLKKGVGKQQLRVYKGGEAYASRGVFSELENLTKSLEQDKKVVEFPELLRISKELLGKTPIVTATKRGKYLGRFRGKGDKMDILIKAGQFKDPASVAKLLAHELGHLADYLPEQTMKRGNLVARIAVLRRSLKIKYGELNNKVVKKELMDLSAKWRPITDGTGTGEDLVGSKYRSSPQELYADAISILFNDPVRLKLEAPEFYRWFFDYLDRKPAVKETFDEIWNLLNQGDEEIFKSRDAEISKGFKTSEEVFVVKELEKTKRGSSLMYQLSTLFNDKNAPILEKINLARKSGKPVPPELNPDYALKGLNYSEGALKNYVNRNFQPIFSLAQQVQGGWDSLGKVVFYERVINERGELANPWGYDPKTATFQLEQMQKAMSPTDWEVIQKAKGMFRDAVQKSVELAEKNEFYTPEMLSIMKANPAYASYQVIEHLDTYISARVYHSIGTLKDIANPATSTVMKLISVHKAIRRNNVKKTNINFLLNNFPNSIQKAKTRWNGKFMEIKDPDDPRFGVVKIIEDGRAWGYYVEKDIADMLNYVPNPTLEGAIRISRVFSQSKFYRPLFTTFNLGFQSFNFVRDFSRYWKNIPDRNLGEAITSLPRAVVRYGMAIKPSLKRVLDRPDEIIQEMEDSGVLGLTYNDMFGPEEVSETTQIERVLQRAGVDVVRKKKGILYPFERVLDAVSATGNFIETLPKVAGYIELKGKLPEEELVNFIRTSVGSPDFRVGGSLTPITNNIFLFSNAIKEGIKTDAKIAFTKNPSRAGFWWKTVVSNFMPKVIMAGIAAGYFGKKLQKQMNDVSEYDKTNYTIIHLFL